MVLYQDFLGRLETTLGQVVSARPAFVAKLEGSGGKGTITVTAEELQASKEAVSFALAGKKLDNKDFLGKSDPYFVISKASSSGFVAAVRSEKIDNDLSPKWKTTSVAVRDLCNNDYKRPLKVHSPHVHKKEENIFKFELFSFLFMCGNYRYSVMTREPNKKSYFQT